jgi:hypothetical protein
MVELMAYQWVELMVSLKVLLKVGQWAELKADLLE